MNHEEAVVTAFILPARQERYLEFLKNPKKRAKFLDKLAHFKHLDPRYAFAITPSQSNAAGIYKILVAKGAGEKCWVISESPRLDGREMDLREALKETVGYQMGTFISCIPGKLGF